MQSIAHIQRKRPFVNRVGNEKIEASVRLARGREGEGAASQSRLDAEQSFAHLGPGSARRDLRR
jgi:hypothetical protein